MNAGLQTGAQLVGHVATFHAEGKTVDDLWCWVEGMLAGERRRLRTNVIVKGDRLGLEIDYDRLEQNLDDWEIAARLAISRFLAGSPEVFEGIDER